LSTITSQPIPIPFPYTTLFRSNHLTQIIPILERAINHQIDNARKAVVNALGELGNAQTFEILFERLIDRTEPSRDVAKMIVSSLDRKSTRLNSSHLVISYAVFC